MAIPKNLMYQRYLSVFGVDASSQQTEKNILSELHTMIHIIIVIIASVLNAVSSLMKVQNKIEDIIKGD